MTNAWLVERQDETNRMGLLIQFLNAHRAIAIDREVAKEVGFVRQVRFAHQGNDDAASCLLHQPFEDAAGRHLLIEEPKFIWKDMNALDAEPPLNQLVVETHALSA